MAVGLDVDCMATIAEIIAAIDDAIAARAHYVQLQTMASGG